MTQQMKHLKTSLVTTDDGNEDNRQQIRIYAKNSMDRFGDDLYGLILSYLLIEDRFQCECVSKQFQRTVFESVVDINLSNKFLIKILCGSSTSIRPKITDCWPHSPHRISASDVLSSTHLNVHLMIQSLNLVDNCHD
ncbi:unnamed protein product [Medioppia subpectinata]|uniref:F-box protein n=1 Tax=Medioppia subpectinata TaxID=1979941 RepID=A0A7R9KV65_9ACAR|nr:unnamed protein product [Medioppia subpectinata]CAG2110472.1 unnamed protein product [Medioppia subpectinata]